MVTLRRSAIYSLVDIAYLWNNETLAATKRFRILCAYCKLTLKFFLYGLLRISKRSERVLGYRFSFHSFPLYGFLFREIFVKGEYRFVSRTSRPLVLDCGANIGMATMYFKYLYPRARIVAFEPVPVFADVLEKNIRENRLKDVSVVRAGVADRAGSAVFSLANDIDLMASMHQNRKKGAHTRAKLVRLATYLKGREVDFLKMDIEGAELAVFRDLDKTGTLRLIREMVVEYHHNVNLKNATLHEFLAILERNDFVYYLDAPLVARSGNEDILIYAKRR